jgi:DNA-binding CsgD family transcriptional regulator
VERAFVRRDAGVWRGGCVLTRTRQAGKAEISATSVARSGVLVGERPAVIRVGVIDEHEIFLRGVVACLLEDPMLSIVANQRGGTLTVEADVVVVSQDVARRGTFHCPVVICADRVRGSVNLGRTSPAAVLPRSSLTPEQLIASVRSAAAGLTVGPRETTNPSPQRFEQRRLEVLRLLAEGADTREISTAMRYSERTVKSIIHDVETELGARTRAQAVAAAIRDGLIST